MAKRIKQMVVWEVTLADAADAKAEDFRFGGLYVQNLPPRHVCFIESTCQTGLSESLRQAAIAAGIEAGLTSPVIRGAIRASEPVASEWLYRQLQEHDNG